MRIGRRGRARAWQALAVLATVALLASFVLTAQQNLLDQGIATGFGFLERTTGWPINFALIDVSDHSPYWRMLLAGLLNTLVVGLLGLLCASVIGILVGLARISNNFVLNLLGRSYVEVFRNVPLILQAFFWYAVLTHLPHPRLAISLADRVFISNRGIMLPSLSMSALDIAVVLSTVVLVTIVARASGRRLRSAGSPMARLVWPLAAMVAVTVFALALLTGREPGVPLVNLPRLQGLRFVGGLVIKPEFSALLIAITVFGGAYIGEIVRGGLLSVDRGRIEAARALGLREFNVNRLVRIPLGVRAMLPALANQYVWLMKATTIGIAIGFPDYFMVVSTSINQSGQTIELLALLMGGFLAINYCIASVMNRINARLSIKGHH